jgi:hypothetical protein
MRTANASALLLFVLSGCNPNSIGRPCVNPLGDKIDAGQVEVSSPALECPSRLCLIDDATGFPRATCTAFCSTDADCSPETTAYCPSSYVCAVVTAQGHSFGCRKLCVCHDDLVCGFNSDADGGVITPPACPNPSPTPHCPHPPASLP